MRAASVVGRRVVKLVQRLRADAGGGRVWQFEELHLDNGDVLYPSVAEQEDGGDYIVELHSLRETTTKMEETKR